MLAREILKSTLDIVIKINYATRPNRVLKDGRRVIIHLILVIHLRKSKKFLQGLVRGLRYTSRLFIKEL